VCDLVRTGTIVRYFHISCFISRHNQYLRLYVVEWMVDKVKTNISLVIIRVN
jgi:hypothetical protein